MFGKLGMPELVVILVIALVIFGPAKLPEIGKAFGRGISEFKSHAKKISEDVDEDEK
ncbi:twin-arginine translocation protein, TatA/E family subunit [Alkaliphilus metalliredigens QYMF]|uniref:Sec-independent protein translocase protein TatA n=1 Tax=Alkaliphilus metalliredigens (strain QYMF) TaxID=293826 RepID=A6TLZ7_ALKMQ|nr:twin-arginine translocase TatA/TatE family subunit [Alkaliphilus metalliredigens]ABR47215.1 twin-arginine translocation protein, TatA/E family subunit [Alkaliphilus metalliredigens QYMF]